ncbi:MAG: ATP-binding protein [Microcoleus sp. PH2017_27_LUM_O_A]|nr:ATP-binding protein [Microcoleus sp. PH2017_11_PCY_U_A]MCC3560026.1 ATP-binding protein [Microcoleus sp. PH2017_27_LUM_O_A]
MKLLSEVTGKKITKKNLRIVLEEAMKERSHASPPQTPPPQVAIAHPSQAQHDQSFALPEKIAPVKNWVGRSRELDTLKSQIFDPDTRAITITAVCLVGLAGIGKTTLTSQLVRELQAENAPFTVAAWETLRSPTGKAPGFDSIIDSLLFTLSNGEISAATTQNDCRQKTEMLIRLLKKQSCLIVLDNVETVLQTGQASRTGYFGSSGFAVKTV